MNTSFAINKCFATGLPLLQHSLTTWEKTTANFIISIITKCLLIHGGYSAMHAGVSGELLMEDTQPHAGVSGEELMNGIGTKT